MMTVPLVDLKKQYAPLKAEILEGIEKVLDGMHLFLGENVCAFEQEFAAFCNARHGIGVSDGTTALTIILRAMGIGPGDEVITVSHTFIATVEAIMLVGARPVFVDIDPVSYLMDVGQVEDEITERTRAILPVHLYGQTVDMDPLIEIANRHGLRVIEDACQAHGAEYKGRRAGSLGDAAAFSFYFSKNLGAYGEGGFITTSDDDLARRIRMIRDHGSAKRYHHDLLGLNGRLDEIQAVVLRAKLAHLPIWNQQRRDHARLYCHLFNSMGVRNPVECPGNTHVYHLYVIQTPWRGELQKHLSADGIASGVHYPIPAHMQPIMRESIVAGVNLPITTHVTNEILSLPMYAELSDAEIQRIAESVSAFFSRMTQLKAK